MKPKGFTVYACFLFSLHSHFGYYFSIFQPTHPKPDPTFLSKRNKNKNNGLLVLGSVRSRRPAPCSGTAPSDISTRLSRWWLQGWPSGVLMVRVLLSWFPRHPLSAIRDLCGPYLNLFRNIIPPIFDTLDVTPLLAFAVLGTLGSILNNSRGGMS